MKSILHYFRKISGLQKKRKIDSTLNRRDNRKGIQARELQEDRRKKNQCDPS